MKRTCAALVLSMIIALASGFGGCVQVGGDEPLVRLNSNGASTRPTGESTEITRLQNENRRLKQRVVELEKDLAEARGQTAPKRE